MKILDPRGPFLTKYWAKIVIWWFVLASFVDFLFFYIPVIDDDKKCLGLDKKLQTAAVAWRTIFDVFYIILMIFQFRIRFNVPSASEMALRYSCWDFLMDVLAVLPLPQVFVLSIIPRMGGSGSSITIPFLWGVVFLQLVPRSHRVRILYKEALYNEALYKEALYKEAKFPSAGAVQTSIIIYMFMSHELGAFWYLLSIDRGITCWGKAVGNWTDREFFWGLCEAFGNRTECVNSFRHCANSTGFKVFLNESCPIETPNAAKFDFGIFLEALQIRSLNFGEKFLYCLWWGMRNMTSLGQNLKTSTFWGEILFAILVFMWGAIYFSVLIVEIQKYMQQADKIMGLEEWRVKMREVEQWMSTRLLPASLRERIKQYEQYKWQKTRGVDEENLIRNLPKDLRRDIKRHLGLDRLKRVPVFQRMDEQLLDALCGHLEQVLYTKGSFIMEEGKPVDAMIFVMDDGKLESSTRIGFNMERGDFDGEELLAYGEELLAWALDPHSSTKLPFSTKTVEAQSEVDAFALKADNLKIVASELRQLYHKQFRHTFKYYSVQWRTWAACIIQVAWRPYHQKKLEEALIKEENRSQGGMVRLIYVLRFAINAICATIRRNGSALTPRLPERIPTMIQKPAEPDFIAEDEETVAESDSTKVGVAFEEGSKGKYAASSSEVPTQARSHPKSIRDEDERYDKLSTQLEEVALAIRKLTDDRLNVNDLYEEVMKTEGFDEPTLALAFDHLVENEKVAKAFMVKNARLRRAWLEGFLKTNA